MVAALLGLVCVVAAGVILVALHFLPTGLDPIRYAVSDYGWSPYHFGYRAMVVLQGVGAILVAVGLGQETGPLGWLVTATAIATAAALVVEPIRRVALGLIERLFYAASIVWLIVVAASIV